MRLRSFGRTPFGALLLSVASFAAGPSAKSDPANPKTIYISSGIPRGGFGDIATNVLMAERIREQFPKAKLTMLVHPEAIKYLETLLPSYDPKLPKQTIAGMDLVPQDAPLPKADVGLFFSADIEHQGMPAELVEASKLPIDFLEYGRRPGNGSSAFADYRQDFKGPNDAKKVLRLSAGAGMMGLYISPQPPPPRAGKAELFAQLKQQYPESMKGVDAQNALLGFTYTLHPEASEAYLKAVAQAAASIPKGKSLLVLAKDFESLDKIALPDNVRLLKTKGTSFELSKDIIANADLPMMITGDISLTLAVERGKPFFYETNPWKERSMRMLREEFERVSPVLAQKKWAETLQLRHRMGFMVEETAQKIAPLLFDEEFRRAFPHAIDALRPQLSLPAKLPEHLRLIAGLDFESSDGIGLMESFDTLHRIGKTSDFTEALYREFTLARTPERKSFLTAALFAQKDLVRKPQLVSKIIRGLSSLNDTSNQSRPAIWRRTKHDPQMHQILRSLSQSSPDAKVKKYARNLFLDMAKAEPEDFNVYKAGEDPELFRQHLQNSPRDTKLEILRRIYPGKLEPLAVQDELVRLLHGNDATLAREAARLLSHASQKTLSPGDAQAATKTLLIATLDPLIDPKSRMAMFGALHLERMTDAETLGLAQRLLPRLSGGEAEFFLRRLTSIKNPEPRLQRAILKKLIEDPEILRGNHAISQWIDQWPSPSPESQDLILKHLRQPKAGKPEPDCLKQLKHVVHPPL